MSVSDFNSLGMQHALETTCDVCVFLFCSVPCFHGVWPKNNAYLHKAQNGAIARHKIQALNVAPCQ